MNRKYRVLAADDEYWSRENIRNLIAWDQYSIEFLEPACDGEEVLERIPKDHPDIILTDINMPFMSGLELLDRIHKDYPDLITVAISGYDDFQKVKGVFLNGGIDYLLKPVSREQLVETLTKAFKALEDRQNRKAQDHKLSSFLEDSEYSAILSGKLYHPTDEAHVPSTAVFSEVSTVLVKFHDIDSLAQHYGHDILQMSFETKEILRDMLGTQNATIFNYSDKVNEYLICATMEAEKLQDFAQKVISYKGDHDSPVTVVIHEQASSLDDIGTVYREMISAMMTRPFCRENRIQSCGVLNEPIDHERHFKNRIEEDLRQAIKSRDYARAESLLFDATGFRQCDTSGWSLLEVAQFVVRVSSTLEHFYEGNGWDEIADEIGYGQRTLEKERILRALSVALHEICGCASETETSQGSIGDQIGEVQEYITQNYAERITLSDLSERYHVDPSYLSRVFSQNLGETITAFITRLRVEHAIDMMKDPARKLEAISFAVGYDDYNYFSRVFRKQTGHSPTEYRKNCTTIQ